MKRISSLLLFLTFLSLQAQALKGSQILFDALDDLGNKQTKEVRTIGESLESREELKLLDPVKVAVGHVLIFTGDSLDLVLETLIQGSLAQGFSSLAGRCVPRDENNPTAGPFNTTQPTENDNFTGNKITCFLVFAEQGLVVSWVNAGTELGTGSIFTLSDLNEKLLQMAKNPIEKCHGNNMVCRPTLLMIQSTKFISKKILEDLIGHPLNHTAQHLGKSLSEIFKTLEGVTEGRPEMTIKHLKEVPVQLTCLSLGSVVEILGEVAELGIDGTQYLTDFLFRTETKKIEIDLSCEKIRKSFGR